MPGLSKLPLPASTGADVVQGENTVIAVFAGQGAEYLDILETLIEHVNKPDTSAAGSAVTLAAFLEASHAAIVREAALLGERASTDAAARFPAMAEIRTLSTLIRHHRETSYRNAALNGALLCITQVGLLLANSNVGSTTLLDLKRVYGFCSGVIAASAAAASKSPIELMAMGVEMTRLAFWIGIRSDQVAASLVSDPSLSWSIVVACLPYETVAEVVDRFNTHMSLDATHRLFVSAVSGPNLVTVSGLPTNLSIFMNLFNRATPRPAFLEEGLDLRAIRTTPLQLCSPYHSEVLLQDALSLVKEDVVSRCIAAGIATRLHADVISPVTGAAFDSTVSSKDFCVALARTILCDTNRLDLVNAHLVENSGFFESQKVEIINVGPGASIAKQLGAAVATVTGNTAEVKDLPAVTKDGTAASGVKWDGAAEHLVGDAKDRIAIVAVSCVFPDGADTPEKFYDMLLDKKSTVKEIPPSLFDWTLYKPTGDDHPNTISIPYGNFIDNPDLFDVRLFNISPREALQMDPQHRLILKASYEALEQAGYAPNSVPSFEPTRIGCFMGASGDDYRENASSDIGAYFITGNIRAFIPGHVSYCFKWEGPSNSIDTGCSSSLVAIEAACNALLTHQCDSALAGGTNVLTQPQMMIAFEKAGLLSPTGQNKTFDDSVDGRCRADAVGVLILKRLEDAIAEKDEILGTILGVQSTFSGQNTTFVESNADAMVECLEKTLKAANVSPSDVSFVAAHGLGDRVGEAHEMDAIARTYGRNRKSEDPVYVTCCKPNVGDSEGASGMASIIESLMILRNGKIPAHLGVQNVNTGIDLRQGGIVIPAETVDFKRPEGAKPRTIAINNFNFAGCYTNLLLQEWVGAVTKEGVDTRTSHIVTVSGKTLTSLDKTRNSYVDYFRKHKETLSLSDVSYTTTARRVQYGARVAVSGATWDEIIDRLDKQELIELVNQDEELQVAVSFGDFTDEHVLAARSLYRTCPSFAREIGYLAGVLNSYGFPGFVEVLEGRESSTISPAIIAVAIPYAMARCLQQWGVPVGAVLGSGTGELAAVAFAGVVPIAYALFVACKNGEDKDADSKLPSSATISGTAKHDLHIASAGKFIKAGETADVEDILCKQKTESSADASQVLVRAGGSVSALPVILDIGNTAGIDAGLRAPVLAGSDGWSAVADSFAQMYRAGVNFSFAAYHRDHIEALQHVQLPAYEFDEASYWMQLQDRGLLPTPPLELEEDDVVEEQVMTPDRSTPWPLLPVCTQPISEVTNTAEYEMPAHSYLATKLIKGHFVHNVGIIPASMYAEIALEAAHHIHDTLNPAPSRGKKPSRPNFEIQQIDIPHPFVLEEGFMEQTLKTSVSRDSTGNLHFRWHSLDRAGKVITHASCWTMLANQEALDREWRLMKGLVTPRLSEIKATATTFDKTLAYRMFEKVVSYTPAYRGMDMVYISEDSSEACTVVQQAKSAPVAKFAVNPCLIDSLGQITGFLPNVGVASSTDVFIANGCERIVFDPKFFASISTNRNGDPPTFQVYSHCTESQNGNIITSNCYFFDTETGDILGGMMGVAFRKIKLSIMNRLLAVPNAKPAPALKHREVTATPFDGVTKAKAAPAAEPRMVRHTPAPVVAPPAPAPAPVVAAVAPAPPQPAAAASRAAPQANGTAEAVISALHSTILEELGITESELTPSTNLADLGLDSLMALMILGTIREKMDGVELPQALFLTYPTMEKVSEFIRESLCGSNAEYSAPTATALAPAATLPAPQAAAPVALKPQPAASPVQPVAAPAPAPAAAAPSQPAASSAAAEAVISALYSTILEELGVTESELTPTTNLADLGLDSLMALMILGTIREKMEGVELPGSLFLTYPTMEKIEDFVRESLGGSDAGPLAEATMAATTTSATGPARIIPISGTNHATQAPVFLLPDGSGSAAGYALVQDLGRPVFGVNSPFISTAEHSSFSVLGLASLYADAIAAKNPLPGLILGGWSFGGVVAYETGRILESRGVSVGGLVLIDSPNPTWPPLTTATIDWCYGPNPPQALRGAKMPKISQTMIHHFAATLKSLETYRPTPWASAPTTVFLSAPDGLGGAKEDIKDRNEAVDWLQASRTNIGTNGWNDFIPESRIRVVDIKGTHHMSILARPGIDAVGEEIAKTFPKKLITQKRNNI
ncbi:hypothetical protein HDU87_004350 [Geranomyces variabilis]|uniref:Polyketide synthase n=1 Tax=Geranomyces variabilis TaxID=109894 RepID=A0AAD5XPZ9_9FUNG|nr:hypothetical protein HDU87_004350 [Geranomyces variabilis]